LRICACSSDTSGPCPARSCCSWAASSAQWGEWDHDGQVDWYLEELPAHVGCPAWVGDLNRELRAHPSLHELDSDPAGFGWAVADDPDGGTLAFLRYASDASPILFVGNFTPVVRRATRIPVPRGGFWHELVNSDSEIYGGFWCGQPGRCRSATRSAARLLWSLTLTLPPLGALLLAPAASSE